MREKTSSNMDGEDGRDCRNPKGENAPNRKAIATRTTTSTMRMPKMELSLDLESGYIGRGGHRCRASPRGVGHDAIGPRRNEPGIRIANPPASLPPRQPSWATGPQCRPNG